MSQTLKPLAEQVVVITGATSGIGLATARLAASRGAKLVVVARDSDAVHALAAELTAAGGQALAVVADVGVEEQVAAAAKAAVARFGHFDTWVNNAGSSVYGQLIDIPTADHRRLFDTNFWGTVYGSNEAARHFRTRGPETAGALINVGSGLGDRAIPVQGMYCASKYAVKGFTESLRMELEIEGVPVSVSLVKPSSIDTPFPQHARNYTDEEPTLPPAVYAPEVVARAILHCAETPERDVTVGLAGRALALAGDLAPRLTDRLMEATLPALQKKGTPPRNPAGSLNRAAGPELRVRGDYSGPVLKSSLYTAAALHPVLTVSLAVGVGLAVAALVAGPARDSRS